MFICAMMKRFLAIGILFFVFLNVHLFSMQVFIITPLGNKITLEVEAGDSIENVKAKITDKSNIPINEQVLMYNSIVLDNLRTLSDYYIQKDSNIYLYILEGRVPLLPEWALCLFTIGIILTSIIYLRNKIV